MLAIVYEGFKTIKDLLAWWTHKWLKPSHHHSVNISEKSALVVMGTHTKVQHRSCTLCNFHEQCVVLAY